ncbi:acetyltransferase [Prochlorococcus marinus]|uniref:Uncharacterized protein n=1 Tax=Prochlorococcus marinus (strain MIT 9303) TaxID=59922 RepID=A2C5V6_PROM3|nr:acetyltransferase [Prochlorococcus marinus]ABM76866.1 Hypothetical protein P9303_01111 [Prochlorococcus marinus str. MIT 9303]
MKKSLLLIGCGGHAKSVIDLIESKNDFYIYGLIGLENDRGININDYGVIGVDQDLQQLRNEIDMAFVAIGHFGNTCKRRIITKVIKNYDYTLPTIISQHCTISKRAVVGNGTSIGHGCVINSGVIVENSCIINSKTLIEHDSIIGEHSHVSTGVIINGNVEIGSDCFIGSGCIIREGLKVPDGTIISAGTRVMGWPLR